MLVVETIARIRREDFITGKTIKEIARDLKVSRNTVRKVLRSGEASFVRSGSPATTEARPVDGKSRRTADREYLLTPSVTKFRNIRWANDCCGCWCEVDIRKLSISVKGANIGHKRDAEPAMEASPVSGQ